MRPHSRFLPTRMMRRASDGCEHGRRIHGHGRVTTAIVENMASRRTPDRPESTRRSSWPSCWRGMTTEPADGRALVLASPPRAKPTRSPRQGISGDPKNIAVPAILAVSLAPDPPALSPATKSSPAGFVSAIAAGPPGRPKCGQQGRLTGRIRPAGREIAERVNGGTWRHAAPALRPSHRAGDRAP
jgi:hypothetical protein